MNKQKEKIILGIDPGTIVMGYSVILCSYSPQSCKLLSVGVVQLNKIDNHYLKLKHIFDKTLSLIEQYLPDELAIEAPFYGKNPQSMLKLGRAQGASIAAALYKKIPITEYSPKEIKLSITGNGNAKKHQVAGMLSFIFNQKIETKFLDATDALAVAYCHFQKNIHAVSSSSKNSKNSWKDFIKNNPGRLK